MSLSTKRGFKGFKAQFTLISLIMVFVMLIIYSQIYPILKPYIDELVGTSDDATGVIIGMVPFFIAVAIVMSILYYIIPQRR